MLDRSQATGGGGGASGAKEVLQEVENKKALISQGGGLYPDLSSMM